MPVREGGDVKSGAKSSEAGLGFGCGAAADTLRQAWRRIFAFWAFGGGSAPDFGAFRWLSQKTYINAISMHWTVHMMISSKTAATAVSLLFLVQACIGCMGETQDKFSGGGSSTTIEFPRGGGTDFTQSIDLPKNITVISAYLELEGMMKSYSSSAGFIDFSSPGGSMAFDGSMAGAPPAGKPAGFETTNITNDAGLSRSDERRAASKARVSFPCHLFEFDMTEVMPSNFNFMWEGQSNLYDDAGSSSSNAAVYLYNCATGKWDMFQNYSVTTVDYNDHVLWANVSSSPENYIDSRGLLNALAVDDQPAPASYTADIQTDYLALWYNGTVMNYPRNVKLDIMGDSSVEWQHLGQLRGTSNCTGAAFVNAIQAAVDASAKDPVNIPMKLSSDRGGILRLSNLSIEYNINNAAPVPRANIHFLEMDEDTNRTALADLRDFFQDDAGVDALTFSIVQKQDPAKLEASMNSDGHSIDLFTMEPNWHGALNFSVRATDAEGLYADARFSVHVLSVDDPPRLKQSGVMVAYQGKPFEKLFTATDLDIGSEPVDPGDKLGFSTNSSYLSMDADAGIASFTPVNSQVGTHLFNVTVTDAYGLSDTRNFTLKVENENDPPVLEPVPDQTAIEDQPFVLQINFSDPDLLVGMDELIFEDNSPMFAISRNGTISFTPVNKDVGEHDIKVTVHDIVGLKATVDFVLTVLNVNDPPRVEQPKDVIVDEDKEAEFKVTASDEDLGDRISYAVNWTAVKIDSGGNMVFTPTQKDVGVHPVTVTVTDSEGASVSVRFNITVMNVNDPPREVRILRPVNGTSFRQGAEVSFEGNATDDDGDGLTYTWYLGSEILGTGKVLSTKTLKPGSLSLKLAVSDGNVTVDSPPVGIVVQKKVTSSPGNAPGFELAAVVAAVLVGAVVLGRRRD